jgi:hypothetical protein
MASLGKRTVIKVSARGKMFDYDPSVVERFQQKKPGAVQALLQRFDPRRLGATLMIEMSKATNESIDVDEYAKRFQLKYDKIIRFEYTDLPYLKPFHFTANAGQLLLLNDFNGKPNTILQSDLNTLLNLLCGNVSLAKARRDGKILIHGEKYAHDEALFFEIFQVVAPKLRKKLGVDLH